MPFTFFFKKKQQNLFSGLVDFHNHILHGIDDGSKSVTQSLSMLDLYSNMGIQKIIASPHIFKDLYPNTPESIKKSFEILEGENNAKKTQIIGYGAEYMIDEFFIDSLKKENSLLCCFENNILIEIPFFAELNFLKQALFELQKQSYSPVLAHPERYVSLSGETELKDLKLRGTKLQLNALSLTGYYGKDVKKKANEWLKKGFYDFIGTDAHNEHHLSELQKLRLGKKELKEWDNIKISQQKIIGL